MGGMSLIVTTVLVRHLLSPSVLSGPMTSISWTHDYSKQSNWNVYALLGLIATSNSPIGRYIPPPASHPSLHPPHPTPIKISMHRLGLQ